MEGIMIVVDKEKCGGCGLCIKICHEHCMTAVNGAVSVDHTYCSTCTQCIAICPQQALSWDQAQPEAYDKARLPTPEQIDEMLKERRTIRRFKEKKVDHPLLEEIVGYGVYAPTNNFRLRAIVVEDEATIKALDQIIVRFSARILSLFYKPKVLFALLSRLWPNPDYLLNKPKLESVTERGFTFDHNASAMVFIAGDKRTPLSEASTHYALYNMVLYGQSKGVGSCLWGPGQIFLTRNREARELLGLEKHERIYGTVLLGYPAVKFANKVNGKRMSIQWNGGKNGREALDQ
jgi:nitroreductase/NAD-dependent dihydropyrimidine dehydrogenase PreA subunit